MRCAIRLIIFMIITCVGFNAAAQVVSDKSTKELKGAVSSCTTKEYKATKNSGEIQKGELSKEETRTYDKKGFTTSSNSDQKYSNTYNKAGKIAAIETYDKDSNIINKRKFDYKGTAVIETVVNTADNIEKTIKWGKNKSVEEGSMSMSTTTYNAVGQPVKCIIETPMFTLYTTNTYNAKGALESTEITIPGVRNRIISYSDYKYDAKGNWIYRVKTQDGEVIGIEEREINY